jgi:hypothetical protein
MESKSIANLWLDLKHQQQELINQLKTKLKSLDEYRDLTSRESLTQSEIESPTQSEIESPTQSEIDSTTKIIDDEIEVIITECARNDNNDSNQISSRTSTINSEYIPGSKPKNDGGRRRRKTQKRIRKNPRVKSMKPKKRHHRRKSRTLRKKNQQGVTKKR